MLARPSLLATLGRRSAAAHPLRHLCLTSPRSPTVPSIDLRIQGKLTPIPVRNIYCIGRNYVKHVEELGNDVPTDEPVVFLKSTASLRRLTDDTPTAFPDETFHHECEMVLLIGEDVPLNGLLPGNEEECVRAIGLGLDLTRRTVQKTLKDKGKPWTTAKSFAGSAIVGPMTPLDGATYPLSDIGFELRVNDEVRPRQVGDTSLMIFDVPATLRFLNSLTPLLRGDLIFTGTPEGVADMVKGDSFAMHFTRPAIDCGRGKNTAPPRVYKGVL